MLLRRIVTTLCPGGLPLRFCLHMSPARATRAAALGVAATLLAGCAAGSSPSGSSVSSGGSLGVGTTVFRAGTGPVAPAVTGTLLGGEKFSLASYRGHVVVLNFWGSWCSICRQEAPELSRLARQYTASGVRFLGVDVADSPAGARAYMSRFRISYPSLNDPGDKIALAFHGVIPIADFPTTLVLADSGHITGRIIGAATYRGLKDLIRNAEAQPWMTRRVTVRR